MKILLVSGFLGAGKTTFIKELAKNINLEFVVLENEYADIGVDKDFLNEKNVYFGLSNMTDHKGNSNEILKKRMKKYIVHEIESNYISRFDNTVKKNSREVYVTNYGKEKR